MPPKKNSKPQKQLLNAKEKVLITNDFLIDPCCRCGRDHACKDCLNNINKAGAKTENYGQLPGPKRQGADQFIEELKNDFKNDPENAKFDIARRRKTDQDRERALAAQAAEAAQAVHAAPENDSQQREQQEREQPEQDQTQAITKQTSQQTKQIGSKMNQIPQKQSAQQSAKQESSSNMIPTLPNSKAVGGDAPKNVTQNLKKDVPPGKIANSHSKGGGSEKRELDKGPPSKEISAKDMDATLVESPQVVEYGFHSPKQGYTGKKPSTEGNEMVIASNHVRVTNVPDTLYLYSLTYSRTSFKTEKRVTFSKRREIELAYTAALKKKALCVGNQAVTNFKELWSTAPIHSEGIQEEQTWESEEFNFVRPEGITSKNVRIEVCYKQKLVDIKQRLQSGSLLHLQDYIRALNSFVLESIKRHNEEKQIAIIQPSASKTFLKFGYKTLIGTSLNDIRANRGYFTSIRPGQTDMLLNINTATSAFLPPSKLPDFLDAIRETVFGRTNDEINKRTIESASKFLKGSTMTILYERGPFKGKEHIDYNSEERRTVNFTQFGLVASQQKFFALMPRNSPDDPKIANPATGKTVQSYFMEKSLTVASGYSKEICVNVGKRVRTAKRPMETEDQLMCEQSEAGAIWIPACFLQIREDQMVRSALPGEYNDPMIQKALRGPAANAKMIEEEGFNTIGVETQPLKKMNFEVAKELIRVPSRPLNPPTISYDGSSQDNSKDNLKGKFQGHSKGNFKNNSKSPNLASWNLIDMPLFGNRSGKIHVVAMPNCFKVKYSEYEKNLTMAMRTIMKAFNTHGLKGFTSGEEILERRELTKMLIGNEGILEKPFNKMEDCTIILIPNYGFNSEEYSYIKRNADRLGKHTLCVKASNLVGGRPDQVASNLLLKINSKYGGDNHHLSGFDKTLASGKRQKTLIIGADVGHPGIGSREGTPSVASLVGSVDAEFMSYRGAMRLQAGRQERIADMKDMTIELLKFWKKHNNNRLPENILFYRDGVSEGQFIDCEKHEIPAIEAAYKILRKETDPNIKITFVVVVKRHHARFYALDDKGTYKVKSPKHGYVDNGNVKPGTLIEKVVTNRTPYNFFLQSHQAFKGTARPAHYHVLKDDMDLGKDDSLTHLTHTLCYAFSRATKGVSYVAPAYMADRLCGRGAAYLREWNDIEKRPKPSFNPSKEMLSKLTKEALIAQKQEFAVELNKALVQKNGGDWDKRKSLWHENLDQGMFWL